MLALRSIRVELLFTAAMLVAMAVLSLSYGLRITPPTGAGALLFGAQVALVLLVLGAAAGWSRARGREPAMLRPAVAVLCYAIVVIVHFNLKLWVPFVRPVTYDALFWRTDQFAYPIVRLCRRIDTALTSIVGCDSGFYLGVLPAMLYISLVYHALTRPAVVRTLILSLLFLQGFGAIAYFLFPALGPFLYEAGANPVISGAQHNMLVAHRAAVAAGPHWLARHGGETLFAGLGAMPSLHAASSYLFLWFAWRHGRMLLPTYVPLFLFILVTAVGSRWHYLVDLPVGMLLAHGSIRLALHCDGEPAASGWRRLPQALGPSATAAWGRLPSMRRASDPTRGARAPASLADA